MRQAILVPLVLSLAPLCLAGEDEARSGKQRSTAALDPAEGKALTAAQLELARDLLGALDPGDRKKNLVLSPASIYQALAMCAAGARGETLAEMQKVLRFPLAPERVHAALGALERELASRSQQKAGREGGRPFTLRPANAVFGQVGRKFEPAYLDLLSEHYGAGLRLCDYVRDPDGARKQINAWVSQATEQKIPELLQPPAVTEDTRLVLVNAVYFLADWETPFEREWTKPGPFTRLDGSKVQAALMHRTGYMSYVEREGVQAVALPYGGGKVKMWVLLPPAGKLEQATAQLPALLSGLGAASKSEFVSLALPRLKFTWRAGLKEPLVKLGLERACDAGQADFSGMDGTRQLFVGSVTHQAFLAVDEQGTEAAAATAVEMSAGSVPPPPVPFVVDRPFLLVIQDEPTGAVLFLARVLDPTAE